MPALTRTEKLLLAAILAVGLGLRIAHIAELRGDVLFDHPVVDEDSYVAAARALVAGAHVKPEAYWQPPGVIYALAAVIKVAGPDLAWPRYLQALVSTATCLLVFALGRRLMSTRGALAAAGLASLHGVLVYSTSELMPPVWIAFFDLLALWLLALAAERKSWALALAGGAALGVSALFTPIVLVFVPVAGLWLWRHASGGARAALLGALALGLAAPVVPVTLRNLRTGGELVLVSANGGINFYIGNNAHYQDMLALRPGRRWMELTDRPIEHGITRLGAKSAYFYRSALGELAAHPLTGGARYLRKLFLFFGGSEIPRDSDIYAARERSFVLAALVWPGPLRFPDGLLIPLALVGVAVSFRERKQSWLVMGFWAAQALVVSAFFVTSRYRVPSLPVCCLFAVPGALWLVRQLRGRSRFRGAAIGGAFVALVAVLNLRPREARASYRAELDFYRGLAYLQGTPRPAEAVRHFQAAAAADPSDARFWFELGNTLEGLGRHREAATAWDHAAADDPWDVRPRRRMAMVLHRLGDREGAARALHANIDSRQRAPKDYAPDYYNLGQLDAESGQFARAVQELGASARLDPEHWRQAGPPYLAAIAEDPAFASAELWLGLGDLQRETGDAAGAVRAWQRAASLAPAGSDLARELQSRLAAPP